MAGEQGSGAEGYIYDKEGMDQSFANFMMLSVNPEEAVLEFGFRKTAEPMKVKLLHRIIVTTAHLRRMHKVIADQLAELERLVRVAEAKESEKRGSSS
ncbi:MAG: DUF3467 domain-containing protein [Planctomycetota bacterium]